MGFVKVVLAAENPINSLVTVNLFDSEFTSLGVGSFKTQLSGEHEIILSFFTIIHPTHGFGGAVGLPHSLNFIAKSIACSGDKIL